MAFFTNSSERMRITSGGNVLIGTVTNGLGARLEIKSSNSNLAGFVGADAYGTAYSISTNNAGQVNHYATYLTSGIDCSHAWYVTLASGAQTQAMTLNASGNLSVGTTTAVTRLTLANPDDTTNGQLRYARSVDPTYYWETGRDNLVTGDFIFSNALGSTKTERMRLTTAGNLLVGTTVTDPITSVVSGVTVTPSTTCFRVYSAVSNACAIGVSSTSSALINFYYNGANFVGGITTNGTITVYGTTSDYRLKENVVPMTGALATVAQLKPVTYKWKSDGSDGQGFIAHELQAVVPDAVHGEKDAIDANGKPVYQNVDTSHLIATLTKAIQEQQALIESLTTRLTALENK
jgi:hypothetical protein